MKIDNHHAYIIEGDADTIISEIKSQIHTVLDIDIFEYFFDNFSIDDSRMIKELDIKSPIKGEKKYIIIKLDSISREAQNALLKVFEDPTPSSVFFVVVPSISIFIETVLSRVEVVRHESFGVEREVIDVFLFIKSSQAKRLEIVSSLLKDFDSEKITRKDIVYFLISIKKYLEDKIIKEGKYDNRLTQVLSSLRFVEDKSASLKLLLERVCLC